MAPEAKHERCRTTIYLDPDVRRALRQQSVDTDRNLSDIANRIFRGALRLPSSRTAQSTQS